MTKNSDAQNVPQNIQPIPLATALGDRYLSYALSTITSRSLPDVRDGLKPVHRRLLFAMRQLRLDPGSAPKKSARVVGDVIGKFHPHGDQSVYDALVRLAQDFAQRYPLVDGQGNFGNIDGDNAAAMRYTEARLTAVAQALLDGIDENAVDFRNTYDEDGEEPVVLPSAFPNLLANGSQGIAVGMATSVPPHNAGELCDALLHLIESRQKGGEVTVDDLIRFVPGPDFPTGGELVETPAAVREAYVTGRGGFRARARWTKEDLGHGQYQIVVTEVPYQIQKSRLVEKIADLLLAKKLPLLEDVRDKSAEDIRLVLVPKSRNVDAGMLMEHLFRQTELESRISLNLNVLDASGVPRVMNLKEALDAFLDHRHEVLVRRSQFRLEKIDLRLEVLAGYLIAHLNLDEVIRIIRTADEPKAELMARFGLTETQADAILNMRLRALHKLQEIEIRKEHDALSAERADLADLLAKEGRRWRALALQVRETREKFGKDTAIGCRRTVVGSAPSAVVVPLEAFVEREPITIFLSAKGWIRSVRGHAADVSEVKYKDGDREKFVLHAETTDRLVLFATNGRFYTLAADKLPRGRGFGEPVRLMVDLGNDADIVTMFRHDPEGKLLVASADGRGFVVRQADVLGQTRAGKQVLNVSGDVEAAICAPVAGDWVAVLGTNRKLLCFPLEEVPEMTRGRGVMLQKYLGATLADLVTFPMETGLSWGRRTFARDELLAAIGKRAQTGRLVPKGFPKANRFG